MRYLTKTLDFDSRGDSVVTLGKFDGLHLSLIHISEPTRP